MNPPADIICFGKDWNEPKTSVNHVMERLARRHRVLWVNSIAMRNANLASGRDLKKIVNKIRSWFRGVQVINDQLRVVTPIVLPIPRSRFAQALNGFLVTWLVRATARRWGLKNPQLWIFPPNAGQYVGRLGESLVVYYCVDDYSEFSYLNAAFMREQEDRLLAKADVVFATAQKLVEMHRPRNSRIFLMPHGVNYELFAQVLTDPFPVAEELRALPHPIVGFYGNLYDWVDQDLLANIARLRPNWSIIVIGKIVTDISTLRQYSNLHVLGPRPYEELPHYCKGFDVGIIPYKTQDPRMQSVNPLKLREYIAAGLPVVSVELPEVRRLGEHVRIATDAESFVRNIEQALRDDSPAVRRARSQAMRAESWTSRIEEIEEHIADYKRTKTTCST